MLRWRLIAAACILGPLFLLIYLDDQYNAGQPGVWLGPLAVLISVMAAHELNGLFASGGYPHAPGPNLIAVLCTTVMTTALIWLPDSASASFGRLGWTLIGALLGSAAVFLAELGRYRSPGESTLRLATGHLAIVYVGVLMSFLIQLRLLPPARAGLLAMIVTLLVVKLADAGAYFVGKAIGKTTFTQVSPRKTLEGLAGGLLFAVGGSLLARTLLLPAFAPELERGPWWAYAGFAATLMLVGLIGDLAESLLKRDVGQKDSSQWLPGLGGVLDILDSPLAVAPVGYLWWTSELLIRHSGAG